MGRMRVALVAIALASGCATEPTASSPPTYQFAVEVSAPEELRVTIDGVDRRELAMQFPSDAHAEGRVVTVELWDGDGIARTREIELARCRSWDVPLDVHRVREEYRVCAIDCCRYWVMERVTRRCDTEVEAWESDADCLSYGACESGCNAVAQTGCQAGERCAPVFDDVFMGNESCVPEAPVPVPIGEPCVAGAGLPDGYDDCAAGAACIGGGCRELCTVAPDSCTEGSCTVVPGLFDCFDGLIGACDTQ